MEKFKKVTDEFIENVKLLNSQVVENLSAKEIVYGSKNQAVKGTDKFAVLIDENGTEYLSNAIFAVKKGLIPDLDRIFEQNSDKVITGKLSSHLFYPEEYDIENKVISKAIDTKLSSEISTSFINSHYFRFFKDNGVAFLRAGKNNTAIMFDGGCGFAGLLMGVKEPDDFESQITLEEFKEDSKLIQEFQEYHKNELIKNIVETKTNEVISKIMYFNNNFKDHLDGDLLVFKSIYGYYDVGYKLKQPIMAYNKEISVFSSTSSIEGYNEYIKDGKHFDGPRQKITKSDSKQLALAMFDKITSKEITTKIEDLNNNESKEFKKFEEDLSLLEVVTNDIVNSLGQNPLNELEYSVNNVFKFGKTASVDIKMFSYKEHFRIHVEENRFILRDVNDALTVIKESSEKEDITKAISNITEKETKRLEERESAISAIKDYTYGHINLIIDVDEDRYLATEYGYQAIIKGKTKGTSFNYRGSRADHIYDLYIAGELESFKITDGASLTKSSIDKLPDIFIKDIIDKQDEENIEMKMLFNLKNASNEKETLQILGDILMQVHLEVTPDTVLSDFFTKQDDLGKELHKLIDKLADKVLEDIDSSTEEEIWILKGYANTISDLSPETSEKIELATILKSKKEESCNNNTSNEEILSSTESKSDSQIISNDTEVNNEVVDNTSKVDTIEDAGQVKCISTHENQSINETEEIDCNNISQDRETNCSTLNINTSVKVHFDTIVDTVNKLEWSIMELLHSNNTIKAAIKNKYNNRKVVGLYAGIEDNSSQQIAELLSNHYSAPICTTIH